MERSSTPSLSPSDYLLGINKVLLAMADNELLLNSTELSGGLYEDFSSQEDTLRVSQHLHNQPSKSKIVKDVTKMNCGTTLHLLLYSSFHKVKQEEHRKVFKRLVNICS